MISYGGSKIAKEQNQSIRPPGIVGLVYDKYNLGPSPSFEKRQELAARLLMSATTVRDGAMLILGRWIESDGRVVGDLLSPNLLPMDRIAYLLMVKEAEKHRNQRVPRPSIRRALN